MDMQDLAWHRLYASRMSRKTQYPAIRKAIAKNLKSLMDMANMSQRDLAAKSGISQRQISNILSGATSCSWETAASLAEVFHLTHNHLLLPGLPESLVASKAIDRLVQNYIKAGDGARHYIDEIAEREAKSQKP